MGIERHARIVRAENATGLTRRAGSAKPATMRANVPLLALAAVAPCVAHAAPLYEARVIVTGTDARSRPDGFARALAQVLAKVAGNPALATDPRVAALAPAAPGFVQNFAYLDRMSDMPRRDEQGTRDRPYDLIVAFDPGMMDAVLAGLGEAPWRGERPLLWTRVQVRRGDVEFPLTADADQDERQRGALLAAGERFGLPVGLPPSDRLAAPAPPGAVPVSGTLTWSDADAGWVAEWRMSWHGREHTWGTRGTGFDAAFRDLVGGAARVLSGASG